MFNFKNQNEMALWINIATQYAGRENGTPTEAAEAADALIEAFRVRAEPPRVEGVAGGLVGPGGIPLA